MAQGKPNSCICCDHKQRKEIDRAILAGDSLRDIATTFATSKDAVYRHKNVCMARVAPSVAPPAEPPEYQTKTEVARNEDVRKYSKGLLAKAISYMNQAEASGDLRTAISAIREAKGCVELLSRLQGDLGPNNQVAVAVSTTVQNPGPPPPAFDLPEEAYKKIGDIIASYL